MSTRQSLLDQEPLSLTLQHNLREFEEIRKIPLSPSMQKESAAPYLARAITVTAG